MEHLVWERLDVRNIPAIVRQVDTLVRCAARTRTRCKVDARCQTANRGECAGFQGGIQSCAARGIEIGP